MVDVNGKKKIPRKKVTKFILETLADEGIDHIFLVPGGVVDPLAIQLSKSRRIHPIVAAHEGGAAFMADGYTRASLLLKEEKKKKRFGVCLGIGGPGVTNMMTAVSAAHGDRSPLLVMAGRIPASWEGKGTFQDSSTSLGIDDIALMRPMTTFAASVSEAEAVPRFLRKAIRAIRDVESLPVFLSIPADIQGKMFKAHSFTIPDKGPPRIIDREKVKVVSDILKKATYVAILAGNGTVRSEASSELQSFAQTYSIPVLTTMRAKGVLPEDHSMSLGVFGEGGSSWANKAMLGTPDIQRVEVLLILGATLNANNTYSGQAPFLRDAKLILVDINPNSNRDIEFDHELVMADVNTFLVWMKENKNMLHKSLMKTKKVREKWVQAITNHHNYDTKFDTMSDRLSSTQPMHPARVIADLRKVAPRNAVVVVDSGAHTFFTGHHWESYGPNEFLFLSTTGPMGYGIAFGIGAWLARQNQPCICIMGDGSMLMHGMELQTAVRYNIPLIVVVINNEALGNVYLRYVNDWRPPQPGAARKIAKIEPRNWETFANSLNAGGIRVGNPRDLIGAYRQAFRFTHEERKPFVIDVICHDKYETPNSAKKFARQMSAFRALRPIKRKEIPFIWHS